MPRPVLQDDEVHPFTLLMRVLHSALLVVVGVTCFAGCQRDQAFHTRAVYRAPLNKYEVKIDASGVVVAGSDVSEDAKGLVRLASLDGAKPVGVQLDYDSMINSVSYVSESGKTGTVDWDWKTAEASLTQVLSIAGFKIDSADELRETVRVINGALSGPKGTILKGQATWLNVLEVTTRYER